jgi:membrane protease YdiL (CAAX protease family)
MEPEMTPAVMAAVGVQLSLWLAGAWAVWRHQFSARARMAGALPSPVEPWRVDPVIFAQCGLAVILGGVFGQVALGMVGRHLLPAAVVADDFWLVAQGAAFQAGMLLGVGLAFVQLRISRMLPPAAPTHGSGVVLPSLAAFCIALPLMGLGGLGWRYLLEGLGLDVGRQELVDIFTKTESPVEIAVMALLAVVVAPVTEELIFRAGLFRYLRTRVPRWIALTAPSLVFSALHANLAAALPLLILGVVFSIAYERTGRIGVPILAHALFNLNTLLLIAAGVEV